MASPMKRRTLLRGLIILPAAVTGAVAGCSIIPPPNLQSPRVALADLALTKVSLKDLTFQVDLDVQNPNPIALPLRDIQIGLSVFDVRLTDGKVADNRIDIPATGQLRVPVTFVVPLDQMIQVLDNLLARPWDTLDYRLAGRATWGPGPFSLPFERTGRLDFWRRMNQLIGRR